MENTVINLIKFGMETLGYKKESGARTYFQKKINAYFELPEDNNTCTLKEVMTFAKEKASKTSKLMIWYNKELEKLLADVFVEKAEEGIKRESYIVPTKTKSKVSKKNTVKDYNSRIKKVNEEKRKSDKDVIADLIKATKKEVEEEEKKGE